MKNCFPLLFLPFLIHCSHIGKAPSPDKAVLQTNSDGLMNQARYLSQEIMMEGKENVDFLLKKLKTASAKYKALQDRLTLLENRVQGLVRRIQRSEDVEITVEEDGEASLLKGETSLFDSDGEDGEAKAEGSGIAAEGAEKSGPKPPLDDTKKGETLSSERLFIQGQNLFIERTYEKAIEVLEEYRNKYPQGAQYTSATYLIGRAFQELKMPEEAQVFFKELTARHPQDPFAEKARDFIKQKSAEKK